MAATKKKTASKSRSSAAKKKTASKPRTTRASKRPSEPESDIRSEIILCLILACAVLIFIANIGLGGPVGHAVSSFLFGMFGIMTYVFPFLLFFAYAFYIANIDNPLIGKKTAGLILLFVFLCILLHLVTEGYDKNTPILHYYSLSAQDHSGGGILGGGLSFLLCRAFGLVGGYIITLAGIMIAVLMVTQHPVIRTAVRSGRVRKEERRARSEKTGTSTMTQEELRRVIQQELALEKARTSANAKTAQPSETETAALASASGNAEETKSGRGLHVPVPEFLKNAVLDKEAPAENESRKRKRQEKSAEPIAEAEKSDIIVDASDEMDALDALFEEALPETETVFSPSGNPIDAEISPESSRSADRRRKRKETAAAMSSEEAAPREKKKRASAAEDVPAEVVSDEIKLAGQKQEKERVGYQLPDVSLMTKGTSGEGDSRQDLKDTAVKLQQTLKNFGVNVRITNYSCGPTVTRYELQPEQGVKVSRILNLADDIKLNLAATDIRIEAPIPGKSAVGIEVPNKKVSAVMLRDLFESPEFRKTKAAIPFAVGKDIGGKAIIADVEKMPHLLIAGATGSGKSVCINTLIMSILFKARPDEVKMLMIDPKVVELKIYDGIPHLLIPVVTDPKKAAGALNWAVQEMTERYNKFASFQGVRDIRSYNSRIDRLNEGLPENEKQKHLPQIVIIVDELADLMMVASKEVEDAICRLAQLARAAGIHLIIATQRPSVDVVTGLIKANMPSRIALAVSSGTDSRTILDMNGAEKLLGHGDMLFYPQDYSKPARVQGAFVSDDDIMNVVKMLSQDSGEVMYNDEVEQKIAANAGFVSGGGGSSDGDRDEYFHDAGVLIIEKDKASIGMLQRAFKIGFNRAARIMDQLSEAGVVGPEEGTKPRKILMSMEEFEALA